MTISIQGRYPIIVRKNTGLYTLDMALKGTSGIGFPMRTLTELYGYTNVGKSSLAYYLAGTLADNGIHLCDLEQADIEYIRASLKHTGFEGSVKLSDITNDKGKPIPHEQVLQEMSAALHDESCQVTILDSIGGIIPVAEKDGDFGEANMGRRAKLVAQVSRAVTNALRIKETPSAAFFINHVHGIIGGRGHDTPGGEAKKFLAAMRIMLWNEKVWRLDDEDDLSPVLGFQVKGQIEKLRFGGRGGKFSFFIVPGCGVHRGATAMFDCFNLGLAEQGSTVKVNGKSLGYIRKDILSKAGGDTKKFDVFLELIEGARNEHEQSPV